MRRKKKRRKWKRRKWTTGQGPLPSLKVANVHVDKFETKKAENVWKLITKGFNAQSEIKSILSSLAESAMLPYLSKTSSLAC